MLARKQTISGQLNRFDNAAACAWPELRAQDARPAQAAPSCGDGEDAKLKRSSDAI